jgi:signal transduction histidine kinase
MPPIKEIERGLPRVKGSADQLGEVIFNLLDNALKAMGKCGVLTLSARSLLRGAWLELRVSDNGVGIKRDHRSKIYDPFFTARELGEGVGLGLSVCAMELSVALVTVVTRLEDGRNRCSRKHPRIPA